MRNKYISPGLRRALAAIVSSTILFSLLSVSASAQPVLYRVSELEGFNFFSGVPAPVHPPITIPADAPAVATVVPNAGDENSLVFGAGDFTYDNTFFNPNPPTGFGIFYSSQGWEVSNAAATLGPDAGFVASTGMANGFEVNAPFFSATGPQPSQSVVGVVPGPNQFGGAFDLNMIFDSRLVFAKVAGGFTAGVAPNEMLVGQSDLVFNTSVIHNFHPTPDPTDPMFSSTACPTSPATCPWGTATTPAQQEGTGVRWTTGMVTVSNALPPFPSLPTTGMITATGMHDLTPTANGTMGTLQLVSAFNTTSRGAFAQTALLQWDLELTFLPEPGPTAMLGAGALGLFVAQRRRFRR